MSRKPPGPHPLIAALRERAPRFAVDLARTAATRGLQVTRPDGTTQPIPVTATPVVVEPAELVARARAARLLSEATAKMARAVLSGPDAEVLLGALSPLERKMAERTGGAVSRLATVRVDFFVTAESAHALEVNATIPAMQAYSDIAAESLIESVGRMAGLPQARVHGLKQQNGCNTEALYRALLASYALERDGRVPARIALLCRRNDAQLTEQRALAERFSSLGTEATVVFPDELSGERGVLARGVPYDLVYRHLFVRRLEQTPAPYVEDLLLRLPTLRAVVVNPPASQLEVKTTFALLSQALVDPPLAERAGLSAEERAAIDESVPWTRPFRQGPGVDATGGHFNDLVAHVAAHPESYVLKRAWDYGGKAVFVGVAAREPSYAERVTAAYGAPLGWPALCQRAAADPIGGGFVVQQLVRAVPQPHVLCSEGGTQSASLYVDFSAYASVGLEPAPPWGGVCRGSLSPIVNIVGGGGVLPLLQTPVADALLAAL